MVMTTTETAPPTMSRRVASWILVVLMAIAVTGSVIGFWVHRTLLDTDAFMATLTPIVESEPVQAVVADRAADQLIEALDLQTRLEDRLTQAESRLLDRLGEALDLPDAIVARLGNARLGLDSLAPMIAAGVESRIREAVNRFISSPEGAELLLQTIEVAHERSVLLLRDEMDQLPNVVVDEGEVRLNLVPVLAQVLRSVVNAGLDVIGIEREIPEFDSSEDATAAVTRLAGVIGRDLPPDFGQVRLTSEASLERAQGLVRAFDLALWVLVIAAVLLAIAAIWLAPSVSGGLVRVGVAASVAALVGWIAVQVIAAQVADAATTADGRLAVTEIVNALVASLSTTTLVLAIVGIGVAAAALLADRRGTSEPAAVTADASPNVPVAPAAPAPVVPAATLSTTPEASTLAAKSAPAKAGGAKAASAGKPAPKSAKDATAKTAPKGTARAKPASAKETPSKPSSASTTRRRRRPPAAGA
jgi:hypothetical protein